MLFQSAVIFEILEWKLTMLAIAHLVEIVLHYTSLENKIWKFYGIFIEESFKNFLNLLSAV